MRDRAGLLGGSIDIGRPAGGGTRVSLRVPARISIVAAPRAAAAPSPTGEIA
jgi:chemotaxis protein histidine kinase CheA